MDELIEYLEQKAREEHSDSWEGYALIVRYLDSAKRRVPTKYDLMGYTNDDIDALLVQELEKITELVSDLFPNGIEEMENYLPANNIRAR